MLLLNDDETLLLDSARGFFAAEAPVSRARALHESGNQDGFDRLLWSRLGEMGFASILIPEADGGSGLGQAQAGLIIEAAGSVLAQTPFLASSVAAVLALRDAPGDVRTKWYGAIGRAEISVAIAFDESGRHSSQPPALQYVRTETGFRLSGTKRGVVAGHVADVLLVSARDAASGDVALFLVERGAAGITIQTRGLIDASVVATVTFADVEVAEQSLVAAPAAAPAAIARTLDASRIGTAAELIGVATAAAAMTFEYLKIRKQFGVAIGSFQALQHRAAQLHCEIELAKAALRTAFCALDEGTPEASGQVHIAKAMACIAGMLAVSESVQMHGGIGMTHEHDIGLYLKRARVLSELYGDADFHAGSLATIHGY